MNLQKFRTLQVSISSTIFVVVFFYFFTTSPKSITAIQLSYWGTLSWVWNMSLVLLACTMFYNIYCYMGAIPKFLCKKGILLFFGSICLSLVVVALVTVGSVKFVHNIAAFYYFFACPLGIFLVAHYNCKTLTYRQWLTHIVFGVVLITVPIYLIHLYEGMAIPETVHSIIILTWNFYILPKRLTNY